jgi:hypothetical protein
MGYFITAHVFREKPNFSLLRDLPKSIGYRAYLHRAANLYLLDTFRASKVPQYPFVTMLPSVDIPLELPQDLEVLERLYSLLSQLRLANSFKKSYVNGATLLNRLLQVPVFSFVSNDDDLDFACTVSGGKLARLKCRCGDIVVSWGKQKLQIVPLVPESLMDEDLLTETAKLNAVLPEAEILPRETPPNAQLHAIAIDELQAFADAKKTILGLGSFDPPEDDSELQLIASR